MAKKVYCLKKRKKSGEQHLFECNPTTNGNCNCEETSICEKMKKEENQGNVFCCTDEDTTRKKCAEIGRDVCGICVSHLYATYE